MRKDSVQAERRRQASEGNDGVDDSKKVVPVPNKLVIDFQHRPGFGEDAEPIWTLLSATNGLIGVFDGLGGAGGETVEIADGVERTGAWLASRIVRDTVGRTYHRMMEETRSGDSSSGSDRTAERHDLRSARDFTVELKRAIQEKLREQAANMPVGVGRLKSRLIKTLPTTMAISWFDLAKREFTVIWAGDSRVYSLRPDVGLLQATTDDLKSNADALENLTDDSPISNCVSAHAEFMLHERRFPLQPYTILMAATDGCFGYVRTPLHFEHMLLSTMQNSTSWSDWQHQLGTQIEEVTGDDATLSAAAFGWLDFASCKSQFANRYKACAQLIRIYDEKHERTERLRGELDEATQDLTETRRSMWQDYRKAYESLTHEPTRDIPERGRTEPAGPPTAGSEDEPRQGQAVTQNPEGAKYRDVSAEGGELR